MTKTQKIVYYTLISLMTIGFVGGAIPKILALPFETAAFIQMHLPLWFMYFIGIAELLGAIGLWIKKLSTVAALGLIIIMIGAVVETIIFAGVAMALMPLGFGIVLGIIIYFNKKNTQSLTNTTV